MCATIRAPDDTQTTLAAGHSWAFKSQMVISPSRTDEEQNKAKVTVNAGHTFSRQLEKDSK